MTVYRQRGARLKSTKPIIHHTVASYQLAVLHTLLGVLLTELTPRILLSNSYCHEMVMRGDKSQKVNVLVFGRNMRVPCMFVSIHGLTSNLMQVAAMKLWLRVPFLALEKLSLVKAYHKKLASFMEVVAKSSDMVAVMTRLSRNANSCSASELTSLPSQPNSAFRLRKQLRAHAPILNLRLSFARGKCFVLSSLMPWKPAPLQETSIRQKTLSLLVEMSVKS